MRTSTTVSKKQLTLFGVKGIVLILWLILWQVLYMIVGKEVLVPSPLHTLQTLAGMVQETAFYLHILNTLARVLLGVGISFILAAVTAVGSYFAAWLKAFLEPAVTLMKATPVMAIIILALLWFKSDEVPVFVCFLMCYPIIYTNVLTGIYQMDEALGEMSALFKVSFMQRLLKCYLPQLRPYLKAALDVGTGMAFKVVIAAEVLAIPKYSMGYQLLDAKIYLETSEVFAWVLVIILLSQLCSMGINMLFKMRKFE